MVSFLSEEEEESSSKIYLTITINSFGMAGSLTNIQLIWSNGGIKEPNNSREQSIPAFVSC